MCHVQEYSEYIYRKYRYYDCLYCLYDYLFEIMYRFLEGTTFHGSQPQSNSECDYECRHHIHYRRDGYSEIGECFVCRCYIRDCGAGYHVWEYRCSGQIGYEPG